MGAILQRAGLILSGLTVLASFLWGLNSNVFQLREQLKILSPLFLEINFFLVILAIVLNVNLLRRLFAPISRQAWRYLLALLLIGMLVVVFVPPQVHRLYYDEDIYANIGQNLAALGKAQVCNQGVYEYGEFRCHQGDYYKEPNGFPFWLALGFRLFGMHENVAFLMNNVSYGLAVLSAFGLAFLLFGSTLGALYAALVYSVMPLNLRWANTVAAEPTAALWAGVALGTVLVLVKSSSPRTLLLAAVTVPLAAQFRPESSLIWIVAFLILLFFQPQVFLQKHGGWSLCLAFFLLFPMVLHLFAVRGETWGATGPKFSLTYVPSNMTVNGLFYFVNQEFPFFLTLLGLVGLSWREQVRERVILLIWFVLFWGVFLPFYAGSYRYGVDVRFSLLSYLPLAILAGRGADKLGAWITAYKGTSGHYIVFLAIVLVFFSFLPLIRATGEEAWAARADHHYAHEMSRSLPQNSIIFTHNLGCLNRP